MKYLGNGQSDIGVWVFQRLNRSRLGNIDSIQTEPDRDGFFVKIKDYDLASEDYMIIACVFGKDLGRSRKEKASAAKGRVKGEGSGGGEVSLCSSILSRGIIRKISSCSFGTPFSRRSR